MGRVAPKKTSLVSFKECSLENFNSTQKPKTVGRNFDDMYA